MTEKELRTKKEIKFDRLFSVFIGSLGTFAFGYFFASQDLIKMFISFLAVLFLIRVDKCNNDLEYGKYIEVKK